MVWSDRMLKYSTLLAYSLTFVLIIVLVVAAFNPGCLNEDTLDQWGQSRDRIYHDWHPVALTIIMTYLRRVYDGFQSVIVLQTLLFTVGVFLTLRKYSNPLLTVALLLGVTLVPPVFFFLGFVGKDSFMACLLIFAIGLFCRYTEHGGRAVFWLAVAALYLAFAVRYNGIFAVLPLLVWPLLRRPWPRIVVFVIAIFFSFLGLQRITDTVFRVRHEYPQQGFLLYDLAALSVSSGTMLVPLEFERPNTSLATVQNALDPYNGGWLFWGPRSVFNYTADPVVIHRLLRTWVRTVTTHPLAYLRWRSQVFLTFAGLGPTELQPYITSCIVPNDEGIAPVDSSLHEWVMDRLQPTGQSLLFRPYSYLLILLAFLMQGLWRRRWDTVLIAFSGLAYSLAYYAIINVSVFRFACFSVFVAVVLIARVIAERAGRKERARESQALRNAGLYVVISGLMVWALLSVVRLAHPLDEVLAGNAVFLNGDFESGAIAPWMSFQDVRANVSSDRAHGGKHSLAETDGAGSLYEDVTGLEPGRRYWISAWASASPGATAKAQIAVFDPVANVATFSDTLSLTPAWQLLKHSVVASSAGTLRIHLFRLGGTGTVYWDDVHIYRER